MAGAHDVRERQERRHQCVVLGDRQDDEGPVRQRHADGLALSAVDAVPRPEAAVEARGLKAFVAEHARAVRVRERRDDEVADLDGADVAANCLDDADELVADPLAGFARLHRPVRPEIAAADAGAGDADEGVGRLDETGVGDVFDSDVPGAVEQGCAHIEAAFRIGGERH